METRDLSPRLLGAMFLVVLVTSISGAVISAPLVGDTAASTLERYTASPTRVHLFVLAELLNATGVVFLGTFLFRNFRDQSKALATAAFGLWVLEAGSGAFSRAASLAAFEAAGTPALGAVLLSSADFLFTLHMFFYCAGGIIFYALMLRSRRLPFIIPLWGVGAAAVGFFGEILVVLGVNVPIAVFLPILPFEITVGVWLVVKGFRS